jgi:hypothetical protein
VSIAKRLYRAAPGFLLIALPLAASGCSLAEYEMKMAESERRVAYFDEQNRALAESSVLMPRENFSKETDEKRHKDFPAMGFFEFFFRPPKGIKTARPTSEPVAQFLYAFPAESPECGFERVLVGGIKTAVKENRAEFQNTIGTEIMGANFAEIPARTKTLGQPVGRAIPFKWYQETAEGGDKRYLFFYEDTYFVVAIVFFVKPNATSNAAVPIETAIDFSLTSMYVGDSAAIPINRAGKAKMLGAPTGTAPAPAPGS